MLQRMGHSVQRDTHGNIVWDRSSRDVRQVRTAVEQVYTQLSDVCPLTIKQWVFRDRYHDTLLKAIDRYKHAMHDQLCALLTSTIKVLSSKNSNAPTYSCNEICFTFSIVADSPWWSLL